MADIIQSGESGLSVRNKLNSLYGDVPVPLDWSGTLVPNVYLPITYDTTLTGNATLSATGIRAGASFLLILRQGGTGGNILSYDSVYKFDGSGEAPVLTTTSGAIDFFYGWAFSDTEIYGFTLNDIR